MKIVKIGLMLALAVLLLAPATASALSVWIEYDYGYNPVSGNWMVPGYASRPSMLGPWKSWADAGKTTPIGNLYCIEANVYEPAGPFHEHIYTPYSTGTWVPPQGGTNAGLQWAAHILRNVDPNRNEASALKRAALQLAIWEALYDYTADYSWSFTGGSFRINSMAVPGGFAWTTAQIQTEAASYLNTYKGQCNYGTVLHDGQDLLRVDVPEPGSLALIGLVLALGSGLAFRSRRKA